MAQTPTCANCRFSITQDTGYSNWTVTGVLVDCMYKLNPQLPDDKWDSDTPVLQFAQSCDRFVEGGIIEFDVDGETRVPHFYKYEDLYALLLIYIATSNDIGLSKSVMELDNEDT